VAESPFFRMPGAINWFPAIFQSRKTGRWFPYFFLPGIEIPVYFHSVPNGTV